MKKIVLLLVITFLLVGCSNNTVKTESTSNEESVEYVPVKKYRGDVFETDIYTELNDEKAFERMTNQYDLYTPGGCAAIGKTLSNGETIIGRNMDLYVSDKPSFIVRTDVPGYKKTFGLTYTPSRGENCEAVEDHGVDRPYYDLIPFLQTDVLNEDGLYIEINMRNADYDASGNSVFSCSGTLPNQGKKRIVSFILPSYLGLRCSTVDEAVKMAQEELDIYTPDPVNSPMDWNFCFLLADATGKYGVLEIAQNKVVWNEAIQTGNEMPNGACHANYYITPEFNEIEKMKAGVGRVDYLKEAWPNINSEKEMYQVMCDISFFSTYFEYCKFDNRSEFVGYYPEDGGFFVGNNTPDVVDGEIAVWDYDYLMNPDNQKYVGGYIDWLEKRALETINDGSIESMSAFWESTFTIVVNPQNRTMYIRFNEDPKNILLFDFNNWK